ncbi:class I SAM-dependent DNA methyltransferase [Schaalia sp. Marseille-Q2122]|uniref:class I SAM-dependent DNA methyltransferase n=1 Tax=Schaalia sp. Marseille-Q2122 TaxID=2736604 RepID=UPI00158A0B76|nr:class I SAM-dependent DNA methyltransferase [Schaalia sp. Marseille-Q2122]
MSFDKKAAREFVERWQGRGYEKGETQQFWLQLLRVIGYAHIDEVLFEHHLPSGGFVDVWIREADVLIEQKSIQVDMDKGELRQGKIKTALEQALDYVEELPRPEQPRYVVTCNFGTFRVYDRDNYAKSTLADHAFEFTLEELADHPEYLAFIVDPANSRLEKEKRASIQAGELIGRLYDKMRSGYLDPDSDTSMHSLNVLCVRLVFCLYCEDAGLFPKDAFYRYLRAVPSDNIRLALKRLFRALDTPVKDRDPYDTSVRDFPYVNGGLFREEAEIPNFSDEMKEFLLREVSALVDWSQISPTIFGGIFESTLNPQTRRSGGMHYSSPENIHKVIDSLFLDELKEEFAQICSEVDQTPRKRKNRLSRFHQKLCHLTFLDPACGSGNFLTETYICLRKLEDAVLNELRGGQTELGFSSDEENSERVSLSQFYGIEINDFAVTVAETALWISRLKANGETSMFYDLGGDDFPLHERANIVQANALRIDWNDVLPAEGCSFIMGNPPFIGQYLKTKEQVEDTKRVWGDLYDGYLDYVTCWYKKASDYFEDVRGGRFAFVSTNSIAQGQPVAALFKPLFEAGWRIRFAHQTFPWSSEAADKAAVHCVIIGFDKREVRPAQLFSYPDFGGRPVGTEVTNINGYLLNGPSVFVDRKNKPISLEIVPVHRGSQPTDGGHLIVESDEYEEVVADAIAAKYVRPFRMGKELVQGLDRWCLWMAVEDFDPADLQRSPVLNERITAVREMRLASKKEPTRRSAETSYLFQEDHQPKVPYVAIPAVVSANRNYYTAAWCGEEIIAGNKLYTVVDPDGFVFSIVSSSLFITWQKAVGGRLKSDLNFSNTIVWNNLPLPPVDAELRQQIIEAGKGVLAARELYPERSLAEHYRPDNMDQALLAAHDALDILVDRAFGATEPCANNDERLAILFQRYIEMTGE